MSDLKILSNAMLAAAIAFDEAVKAESVDQPLNAEMKPAEPINGTDGCDEVEALCMHVTYAAHLVKAYTAESKIDGYLISEIAKAAECADLIKARMGNRNSLKRLPAMQEFVEAMEAWLDRPGIRQGHFPYDFLRLINAAKSLELIL